MSIIDRPNQIDGKQHILDSPGIKQDFFQFLPAKVIGVANCAESLISKPSNAYNSNQIQVSISLWSTDLNWSASDLRKVKPLFRGFSDSVTIGESVLVTEIGGQLFYLGPINLENNPSVNYDTLSSGNFDEDFQGTDSFDTSATFPPNIKFKRLNKNFKPELDDPQESIERISHPETGREVFSDLFTDVTFEGRFGNSIRLGARNINPLMIFSNGRNESQIEESVNDGSILAMFEQGTISQHFPFETLDGSEYTFKFADEEVETPLNTIRTTFLSSLGRGNGLEGEDDEDIDTTIYGYESPQTLLNSDRVMINAKRDNLFLSAFQHIHLGSGNSMTFSTSNNTLFNVTNSFVVNSPEIKLGSQIDDETEPLVLGDTLVEKLTEICDHLTQLCTDISSMTHPTPAGPSGPPVNAAAFSSLSSTIGQTKGALEEILSSRNRTS